MHDDWVRHRSSERFFRNVQSIGSSGISQSLRKEVTFVTMAAVFVVAINMLLVSYQDFDGVSHVGALANSNIRSVSLPALPFSIASPALSLLLVFRTNTGYSRWNEVSELDATYLLTLPLPGTRPCAVGPATPKHPWLHFRTSGLQPHASRRARFGAASSTTAATLCAGAT